LSNAKPDFVGDQFGVAGIRRMIGTVKNEEVA
jgi:hypothetical protein